MDYQLLKTEIETGPLSTECVGKSDDEIANIFNTPRTNAVSNRKITIDHVLAECENAGEILDKLEVAANIIPDVKWAMRCLSGIGLDIGNQKTQAQLTALAGSVLTIEEAESLKAMAIRKMSRAEMLGLGTVTAADCGGATRGGLA